MILVSWCNFENFDNDTTTHEKLTFRQQRVWHHRTRLALDLLSSCARLPALVGVLSRLSHRSFRGLVALSTLQKWGSASRSTSVRPESRLAMPAENFTASSMASSLMAKFLVIRLLVEVTMLSTPFSVKLVPRRTSLVLCLSTLNPLSLMKWGLDPITSSST